MAALDGDRQPDKLVLDLDRTAAVEAYFGVLKRINDLSRILFASLGLCQATIASTSVGKVLEMWSCQVSASSSTRPRSAQYPRRAR